MSGFGYLVKSSFFIYAIMKLNATGHSYFETTMHFSLHEAIQTEHIGIDIPLWYSESVLVYSATTRLAEIAGINIIYSIKKEIRQSTGVPV